jgi:hypothetical protein
VKKDFKAKMTDIVELPASGQFGEKEFALEGDN